MTATVVVTDHEFPDVELERRIVEEAGFRFVEAQCINEDELVEVAADADALINQYAKVTASVLERLPKVQVVSRYGIGVDTIDVEAATRLGIIVGNVPDGSLHEVSEHAAAMILGLARGLGPYGMALRAGDWDYRAAAPLRRFQGSTLGLIGFGAIPQTLLSKLSGFALRVIAYDPFASSTRAAELGVELLPLEDVLAQADAVSVHVPRTPDTVGLLDADAFALMQPHAVVVNTARGGIIDEDALLTALQEGRIAGAGLDVFDAEPLAPDHPFRRLPNVLVSPHSAWYSEDSEVEIRSKATRNVVEVLQGRAVPYLVNRDVLTRPLMSTSSQR